MLPLINRSVNSYGRSLMQVSDVVAYAEKHKIPVAALTDVHSLTGVPEFLLSCEKKGIHGVAGLTLQILDGEAYRGELVLLGKGTDGFLSLKSLLDDAGHVANGDKKFNPKMGLQLNDILSGKYQEQLANTIALDGFPGSIGLSLVREQGAENDSLGIRGLFEQGTQLSALKKQFPEGEYLAVQMPNTQNAFASALLQSMPENSPSVIVESTIAHANNQEDLMACKQWFSRYAKEWLETFDETKGLAWVDELYRNRCLASAGEKPNGNPEPFLNSSYFTEKCDVPKVFNKNIRAELINGGQDPMPLHLEVSQAWSGFKKTLDVNDIPKYADRLRSELSIIYKQGFEDYFRNIQKIQRLGDATNNGYMLRGSAVSSLTMHVLGVTPVDPVANGLLFKRFLDDARAEEPDADLEFVNPDVILNDLLKEFDENQFAVLSRTEGLKKAETLLNEGYKALVQFRSWKPEQRELLDKAFKFIGTQKKLTAEDWGDFVEKNVPEILSRAPKLPGMDKAINKIVRLSDYMKNGFTGAAVNKGSVIVAPEGIDNYFNRLVIGSGKSGIEVPRIDMTKHTLGATGLIKYDLLSNNIFKRHYLGMQAVGLDPNSSAEYDDKSISHVFHREAWLGISQMGGFTGENLGRSFKPENFKQLTAMFALMRDANVKGDNDVITGYVNGKQNPDSVNLPNVYQPILGDTYGVMLYEEQLMMGLTEVGGFTWAEADKFRSALKKGKSEIIDEYEGPFIEKTMSLHNVDKNTASAWYEPFRKKRGRFVFSKAHGCAYAHLAVQQCAFKCLYPAQYASELYMDDNAKKSSKKISLQDAVNDWKKTVIGTDISGVQQSAMDLPAAIKTIILRESEEPLSTYKKNVATILSDVIMVTESGMLDDLLPQGVTRQQLTQAFENELEPLLTLQVNRVNKNAGRSSSPSKRRSSSNANSNGAAPSASQENNDANNKVEGDLSASPAEDVIPLNRRSGFIDWSKGVMPMQLIDFLSVNRLINIDSLDQTKAAALDHVKFHLKSPKDGQIKKFYIAAVAADPERMQKRKNYDLNFAMHQGGAKNGTALNMIGLMAELCNAGISKDAPQVHMDQGTKRYQKQDLKNMFQFFSGLAKKSKFPLFGVDALGDKASETITLEEPLQGILTELLPRAKNELEKDIKKFFDDSRMIRSDMLGEFFDNGLLSLGQRFSPIMESKRNPGTQYRGCYSNIYANFVKVKRGVPIYNSEQLQPGVLSEGGHQYLLWKQNENKVSRIDHGTNAVRGHFFGVPKPNSDFIWMTEGVFDTLSFNELNVLLGNMSEKHNLPFAEPNSVSVKSAGGAIPFIEDMLGIEFIKGDDVPVGDFVFNDGNKDLKPFSEEMLVKSKSWFMERTIHWIDDGSQESLALQRKLGGFMRAVGMSEQEIAKSVKSHHANKNQSRDAITHQLCRKGAPSSDESHIILHKGVMPQWLRMNAVDLVQDEKGVYMPAKVIDAPNKSEPFSKMSPEQQGKVVAGLRKRFEFMSGAKGIGFGLDADPAGLKDIKTMRGFCETVGIPHKSLLYKPRYVMSNGDVLFDKPKGNMGNVKYAIEDHNDVLKVAKIMRAEGDTKSAFDLLKSYADTITPSSIPELERKLDEPNVSNTVKMKAS